MYYWNLLFGGPRPLPPPWSSPYSCWMHHGDHSRYWVLVELPLAVIIMTMIMIISRAHIDLYPIIAAGRRAHKTAQTTCQEVLTRGSSSSSSCPLSLKRITFAVWIWNLAQTPRWCLNAKFQNPPLRNVMFVVNTENLCEFSKFWVSFQSVFPVKYHFLPKQNIFFHQNVWNINQMMIGPPQKY